MARARTIKPGFFQNEFMASKAPEVQLLFLGLLTIADRDGRLEDRPLKIKGQVFPFTEIDIDAALNELASTSDPFQDAPFIFRYTVDGRRYIQVVNWEKHQNVHPKEVPSTIPPMPCFSGHACVEKHGSTSMHEGKAGELHGPAAERCGSRAAFPSLPSLPSCTSIPSLPSSPSPADAGSGGGGEAIKENFYLPVGYKVPSPIAENPEFLAVVIEWCQYLFGKLGAVVQFQTLDKHLRDAIRHGPEATRWAVDSAMEFGWRAPNWKGLATRGVEQNGTVRKPKTKNQLALEKIAREAEIHEQA